MILSRHSIRPTLIVLLALGFVHQQGAASTERFGSPRNHKEQVEADWLRQEYVLSLPDPLDPITTVMDASGGCDGEKKGRYGFHTAIDEEPWWQVDLGRVHSLGQVIVYNRCDTEQFLDRSATIGVLVSADGESWEEVYQHNGKPFGGVPDEAPLAVRLKSVNGRYVRIQLAARTYLHLDEVEVYGQDRPELNLALRQPADQSSVSQWSTRTHIPNPIHEDRFPIESILERGNKLVNHLRESSGTSSPLRGGVDAELAAQTLDEVAEALGEADGNLSADRRQALYTKARWAVRKLALANPLLDFDKLLFVKRVPGTYSHMSDQYYGWWSRPGGGVYVLEGFKSGQPTERCLTESFPPGSFLRPDISYDGKRILFSYCRYYPHLRDVKNKVLKDELPEDGFYHTYEMNIDGTGVRQLTRGRYDDFDARYLPNGEIVFLSTRRGQFVQCGEASAMSTLEATHPDSYVRCGGGDWRPVAVYTLHVMDTAREKIRSISPFENFEWTPSIMNDGRIMYARWDYVDRDNMPFMSLWSTTPEGTQPNIVYGNFTHKPHSIFEARSIPNSNKIVFTGSAHHSITGGCLVLLDPTKGLDDETPVTRLTPEVCFPETEAWPHSYYANPYPLSETVYLTAWSDVPLTREGGPNPPHSLGLYLYDAYGNLELIYRDSEITCMYPIPIRQRPRPSVIAANVDWQGAQESRIFVQNVYEGLKGIQSGTVKRLRIIGTPAKTQPQMNTPRLGMTRDDPGKFVLGTVPVAEDGSAHFVAPSGVGLFFQALDAEGYAVQTMRTLTYAQPGQTLSCIGCHESRNSAPPNGRTMASSRAPSKIQPGPQGSWPFDFKPLVGPVLEKNCVRCHSSGASNPDSASFPLTGDEAYDRLVEWGKPSLKDHVLARYYGGRSLAGQCVAQQSTLLAMLREGHKGVELKEDDWTRLITWMDVYAQRLGSFSENQVEELNSLKSSIAHLLTE